MVFGVFGVRIMVIAESGEDQQRSVVMGHPRLRFEGAVQFLEVMATMLVVAAAEGVVIVDVSQSLSRYWSLRYMAAHSMQSV